MSTPLYRKILAPVDGSETSTRGLDEAIRLAKNQDAQLRLIHVVNELIIDYGFTGGGGGFYSGDLIEALREGGKKILADAEAHVRQQGIEPQTVLLEMIGGAAAAQIITQAKEWPADVIVMGTHGRRGIRRLTMGSDAEHVIRASPVPVLLVRSASEEIAK